MTIEERKDRLMHIILNCGNDEALLSQLEETVVAGSRWGQLITEDPGEKRLGEGLVREDLSSYGGSDLTAEQWEGLREAQESIRNGGYFTDSEIWEEFDKRYGFR